MHDITQSASVVEAFRRNVSTRPDQDAVAFLADPDRPDLASPLTYSELDREARGIAAWLQEQGHRPGSRALLLYPVGTEFVAAFLGCLYAGVVAVPAPLPSQFRHHRTRLRNIALDAGVAVVLTDGASADDCREWADAVQLTDVEAVVTRPEGRRLADPDDWTPVPLDQDTLALLQYTSGSTGDAKGVMITHGNVLHNVEAFARAVRWTEETRSGGWVPLYHDMGLSAQLLPALLRGGSCVLMDPMAFARRPVRWLRAIGTCGINVSFAPNFAYDLCTRRVTDAEVAQLDLSHWTYAANGSEPVQPDVLTAFTKRFAAAGFREEAFAPSYGMAEVTVYVSSRGHQSPLVRAVDAERLEQGEFVLAEPGRPARHLVSNGPAPAFDIRIVDPVTHDVLPEGRIGEIWIRGASVAVGYWGREEATQETFRGTTADGDTGYLRSGDLGTVHEGELYINGRIKEMVIVNGRNLYPHDVEHELRSQHPELAGFGAVFTAPERDDAPGAATESLVVTHEVRGVPADELAALAGRMQITVSREFGVRVDDVLLLRPGTVRRTTSGKIQRAEMRSLYLAGELKTAGNRG
ncbi:fatty acyl-AMP ligase [Streptomyces coelicoflavus]|uniref:fatty acyl-AMP ligase n=1 Tax=Streptomyces coelicoflavus TaxID=285562 RepID=UPI002E255054